MTISLITPTYNSAQSIRDTLDSVSRQTFPAIEHIIIDGLSKDETLNIVNEYRQAEKRPDRKISVLSESDQGLYDAMNKGIKRATGDIVGILNSDDFFRDDKVLSDVAACFLADPTLDACYGDLEFVAAARTNRVVRVWRAGAYDEKKLAGGWIIPHPAFFARRTVYEKFGSFRPEFRLAGDYELMLRLLKLDKIKTAYLPRVLTRMRTGGASGRNLRQRRQGWSELRRAWTVNGLNCPPFFITRRVFSKLKQYI